MHIDLSFGLLWPLIHPAVAAAAAAATYRVCVLAGHAADSIRDQRIRTWAQTLILAAESTATAPSTGPQKKEWVIDRVRTLFPRVPRNVISDLVEGILCGVRKAEGHSPQG